MKQIYENYTNEDFAVWRTLYERQIKALQSTASHAYLEGLSYIKFSSDEIAKFDRTNELLQEMTGWKLVVVPGIVPDYTFFELMANKRFPATTWLRKMKELDYLEEPDMFHDVFAHVPLLTNKAFTEFLEEMGKMGLNYTGDDVAIELLSRIYWFTVEFGLIRENGAPKIYGAGILSSAGETEYCLSEKPSHYDFNIDHILNTPYRKDIFQEMYFLIDSYDQLFDSMDQVSQSIAQRTSQKSGYAPA